MTDPLQEEDHPLTLSLALSLDLALLLLLFRLVYDSTQTVQACAEILCDYDHYCTPLPWDDLLTHLLPLVLTLTLTLILVLALTLTHPLPQDYLIP